MNFQNGQLISIGNTNETELNLISPVPAKQEQYLALITVITATTGIQFSSGENIPLNAYQYPEESKLILPYILDKPLRVKQGNAGDSFVITVI